MRISQWTFILTVAGCTALAGAAAQQKALPPDAVASPITYSIKAAYTTVKGNLTKSAEMVPAKAYLFKPAGVAPEVRTFGQIVGHVANANYAFCGAVAGEKFSGERGPGGVDYEKTTDKAALQKALAESFAYCDKTFADVNDRNAGRPVTGLPIGATTRLGGLAYNNAHLFEHYGNLVTYLRAMGMVPPSSQPSK